MFNYNFKCHSYSWKWHQKINKFADFTSLCNTTHLTVSYPEVMSGWLCQRINYVPWSVQLCHFFFFKFCEFLKIFLIDRQKLLHRHSWFPEDESKWLTWSCDVSLTVTMRLTFVVLREKSRQLWTGLPWNFLHTFMFPLRLDCENVFM